MVCIQTTYFLLDFNSYKFFGMDAKRNYEDDYEKRIVLVFDEYDGHVYDLISILSLNDYFMNTEIYPNDLCMRFCYIEKDVLESIKKLKFYYDLNITNEVKNSNLVVFIATNSSVESDTCIQLLQLSKNLNIPILSLVVENLSNECKSIAFCDHWFEVFKDRAYNDGYDQQMYLGKPFQCFIERIIQILNNKNTTVNCKC